MPKIMSKGVSPLLAATLLVALTVGIATLVTGFTSTIFRTTEYTVTNRTTEAVECTNAAIVIDDAFVIAGDNGTATVPIRNSGFTNDLQIISAQLYDRLGNNFSASSMPITNFDKGMILSLRFQLANLSDTTTDSSSYGNNGTLGSPASNDAAEPSWTLSGYRSSALIFDGVDDFVNVSDSNTLDLTRTFTLEAWINTRGNTGTTEIISKFNTSTNGYRLRLLGNNSVRFDLLDNDGTVILNGTKLISNSTWTHVAASNNNGTLIIYINGVRDNNISTVIVPTAGTAQLHIGSNPIAPAGFFNGTVDDVKVWNRTLTDAEINQSKDGGLTSSNNLVGYWGFSEGKGVLSCPQDFSQIVVATNCGGISATFNRAPKCS